MKRLIIVSTLVLTWQGLAAQQKKLYHFQSNYGLFNPASAGLDHSLSFAGSYRNEIYDGSTWGLDSTNLSNNTSGINIQKGLAGPKMGAGISISNLYNTAFNTVQMDLQLAKQFQIKEKTLSIGLQGSFIETNTNLITGDSSNIRMRQYLRSYYDAGVGMVLTHSRGNIGLAVTEVLGFFDRSYGRLAPTVVANINYRLQAKSILFNFASAALYSPNYGNSGPISPFRSISTVTGNYKWLKVIVGECFSMSSPSKSILSSEQEFIIGWGGQFSHFSFSHSLSLPINNWEQKTATMEVSINARIGKKESLNPNRYRGL